MRPLRFGVLTYLNCLPATLGLEQGKVGSEKWCLSRGNPADLNRMMRQGELDVSLVSAAEYLANETVYERLQEFSLWCEGPVQSVCLFSGHSAEELESMKAPTIAVTPESASSVALTELLLTRCQTEPFETEEGAEVGLRTGRYQAVLLIGDRALQPPTWAKKLEVHDLCQWWSVERGLPMTFAVWVARADIDRGRLQVAREVLNRSLEWGREHKATVLSEACHRSGLSESRLENYYQPLNYRATERSEAGFREYRSLLMRRKVVHHSPRLAGVASAL